MTDTYPFSFMVKKDEGLEWQADFLAVDADDALAQARARFPDFELTPV